MNPQTFEFHPIANLFPLIEGAEYADLVADVARNGVIDPIEIYENKILDGRNRFRAWQACGSVPEKIRIRYFSGLDPLGYVISKNLRRRHLSDSQRAMIAAELPRVAWGSRISSNDAALDRDTRAEMLNVSARSVDRATEVLEEGVPELADAVKSGDVAVSAAAHITALPKDQQVAIMKQLARDDAGHLTPEARAHVKSLSKEIRAHETAEKIRKRAEMERALGEKQRAENNAPSTSGQTIQFPEFEIDYQPKIEMLEIGKAGEHLVCADLLKQGYKAFLSDQGMPFDLVVEFSGVLLKVQVKTCVAPRNISAADRSPRFQYSWAVARRGKNNSGRLSDKDCDVVALVALDLKVIAYFAVDDCGQTIQLHPPGTDLDNGYARSFDRTVDGYPFAEAVVKLANCGRLTQLRNVFPPFPARKFGVIYADPCWAFETWAETGKDRGPENHYPTLTPEYFYAMGPYLPAADDCVLWLWATAPTLRIALHVMKRWDFKYVTNFVWAKDRIGTGYWGRNQHEMLLVGTRGHVPAPAMGTQVESVIQAPVGEHSAKPEIFADIIDRYFPSLEKIELFRRGPARLGWSAWGLEAESYSNPIQHIEPGVNDADSPPAVSVATEPSTSAAPAEAGAGADDKPGASAPPPGADIAPNAHQQPKPEMPPFMKRRSKKGA